MAESKSTCCYCGVGCGVIIESHDGHVTGVRGDPNQPANFGCGSCLPELGRLAQATAGARAVRS
jgi:predicted molibdopterin-dependent oxidoreductase YjgC